MAGVAYSSALYFLLNFYIQLVVVRHVFECFVSVEPYNIELSWWVTFIDIHFFVFPYDLGDYNPIVLFFT